VLFFSTALAEIFTALSVEEIPLSVGAKSVTAREVSQMLSSDIYLGSKVKPNPYW